MISTMKPLERLRIRAAAWGLKTWLRRVLMGEQTYDILLVGEAMTGKTQFISDLDSLGLIKERISSVTYLTSSKCRVAEADEIGSQWSKRARRVRTFRVFHG